MLTAPAVTEQHIYCVATDGKLTGLDRSSLKPVWDVVLGAPGRYISSPVVAYGHVYVGTPHDGLICAGEPQ
jgi:outer membrane protein assembly factor BamB